MEKVTVEKADLEKLKELDVSSWTLWEHGAGTFDWKYDSTERFYVLAGRVKVSTEDGQEVEFGAGDLVTFPRGVKCTWNVIEPIHKVYRLE